MKAKKFLSVLCAVLIMSVVACFGVMSVSAEEVPETTVSDSAVDTPDSSVDEDVTDEEDVTDDETDEDFVDDEELTDDEDTEDDMADTETEDNKPSPTTGDTATPISAFALLVALSGTAVAGYKLKKSE